MSTSEGAAAVGAAASDGATARETGPREDPLNKVRPERQRPDPPSQRTKPLQRPKTPSDLVAEARNKQALHSRAAEMIGHIGWLMMLSGAHKHMFLADLEWLVVPPITHQQFRLYTTEKTPWAYVSWAFLTEEAEARLVKGQRRLQPAEWRAGDRPWLIDLICPFGGAESVLSDIRNDIFPDATVKTLVPVEGGQGMRVMELRGGNLNAN